MLRHVALAHGSHGHNGQWHGVVEGSEWCGGDWWAVVEAMYKPQVEVLVVVSLVSIVSCLAGSYKPGQTCDQCPGVKGFKGLFNVTPTRGIDRTYRYTYIDVHQTIIIVKKGNKTYIT